MCRRIALTCDHTESKFTSHRDLITNSSAHRLLKNAAAAKSESFNKTPSLRQRHCQREKCGGKRAVQRSMLRFWSQFLLFIAPVEDSGHNLGTETTQDLRRLSRIFLTLNIQIRQPVYNTGSWGARNVEPGGITKMLHKSDHYFCYRDARPIFMLTFLSWACMCTEGESYHLNDHNFFGFRRNQTFHRRGD